MAEIAILPRTLVFRTAFGTGILWVRRTGFMACDNAGRCQVMGPVELRHCYPEAWGPWVRLAALLPVGESVPLHPRPRGGAAA